MILIICFISHFGYYTQAPNIRIKYIPLYQNTHFNKTTSLYFRNPYLYSQITNRDTFYFSLISKKDVFTSIQLIYHHIFDLYGEDTTKFEVGELVFVDSNKFSYPFVMDDIDPW